MLPITFFRSSSLNRWSFCQQLFVAEYALNLTSPSGLAAAKGTCVHCVLEIMALAKKAKQEGKKSIQHEIVGKVLVDKYDVSNLIDKVYDYYSSNMTHLTWANKDYKEVKDWTWLALTYDNGRFDPRNLDIIDAEPFFDFEIEEDWAYYKYDVGGKPLEGFLRMKGTIDLIHRIDGDIIEITDYKTGSSTKNWSTGQLRDQKYFQEKDIQLRLYHYAATKLYPWATQIMATIFFIRGGGPFTVCFTDDDLDLTKQMIKKIYLEVKNTSKPALKKEWKCNLCHLKKQSFEEYGCHADKTLVEFRGGKFAPRGDKMKMCDQLDLEFSRKGCERTLREYSKPGFDLGYYHDPGSIS